MRKINITIITAISIGFSGCISSFNPRNQGTFFVKGKPYRIPYGASYTTVPTDSCGKGKEGIFWVEEDTAESLGVSIFYALQDKTKHQLIMKALQNGLARCSYPLSEREYQHYKQK
jgi:hypothetical protein